jgi:hypothetical protein
LMNLYLAWKIYATKETNLLSVDQIEQITAVRLKIFKHDLGY